MTNATVGTLLAFMQRKRRRLTAKFFSKIGTKGGSASGKTKRRGTPEYYAELGRKSAAKRAEKRAQAELFKPGQIQWINVPNK